MPAGAHTDIFKSERRPVGKRASERAGEGGRRRNRVRTIKRLFYFYPALPLARPLFWSAERFQQAQRHVALRRILLRQNCDLLPERRQIQRPVDHQQQSSRPPHPPANPPADPPPARPADPPPDPPADPPATAPDLYK